MEVVDSFEGLVGNPELKVFGCPNTLNGNINAFPMFNNPSGKKKVTKPAGAKIATYQKKPYITKLLIKTLRRSYCQLLHTGFKCQ